MTSGVSLPAPDSSEERDVLIDCLTSFDMHGDTAGEAADYILSEDSGLSVREACWHPASTGDEGPNVRNVVRWRCDACGQIHYSDDALAAVRGELAAVRDQLEALVARWRDEAANGHGAFREVNARRADELQDALAGPWRLVGDGETK